MDCYASHAKFEYQIPKLIKVLLQLQSWYKQLKLYYKNIFTFLLGTYITI